MDQETRWLTRYKEVVEFIEREHRNPSKYVDEETPESVKVCG